MALYRTQVRLKTIDACSILVSFLRRRTSQPDPCQDRLNNCKNYGNIVCVNYAPWSKDNCARYCGFCTHNAFEALYTTGPPPCVDGLSNCRDFGLSVCHDEKYTENVFTKEKPMHMEINGADGFCICPLYYNLPSSCTLVQSPNDCCQKPVCNFNQHLQTVEGTAPAVTTSGVCKYMYFYFISKIDDN
ncbi:hypothetical protein KUTeg_019375 [Tegillarca granosa]|uniref:ShKT domain-containing protein n=1 Tax=Tegillarca granosa TaxID=220873 RepID=A0ABQ9ECC2_TEGGR|nr:hypothetical protein KUTeg_019375 [Tegillarca granosa]